jgi:hypothetical protein
MEYGHNIERTTDIGDAGNTCAKCLWYVAHYLLFKHFYYFIALQCTIMGHVQEHGWERRPRHNFGHGKYR